ncbi:MAG: hypothetical protein PHP42_07955 [Bacteroidota bacterium]|nr:hypothetical protein [Bacteroidota bacterium]
MKFHIPIFLITMLVNAGCNEGLQPISLEETGFGGTISFVSKLPPPDSLFDFRIVAVPYYPIDTTFTQILIKILNDSIAYSPSTIQTLDSGSIVRYKMLVKPKIYRYVACVQQYGPDSFKQWKVVGIYGFTTVNSAPSSVVVKDGIFTNSIDMVVDFYHLPPQPFKTP